MEAMGKVEEALVRTEHIRKDRRATCIGYSKTGSSMSFGKFPGKST